VTSRAFAATAAALFVVAGVGAVLVAGGAPGSLGPSAATTDTPNPTDTSTTDAAPRARVVATNQSLVLPATEDALVRGETSLASGSELSIRVRSTGESPFIRSRTATVAPDGTVRVRVDLASVDPGTPVTVSIVRDGTTLAERRATVVGETEAVTLTDGPYAVPAGEAFTVRATTTYDEGRTLAVRLHSEGDQPFILSREVTVGPDGEIAATFDTEGLAAESRFRVSVVTENGTRVASGTGRLTE
jgi:hypothetical protein